MPITPRKSENEEEFIGRCMSEEKDSFPDETQRYAVCKSKWDAENLSEELPAVKGGETLETYIRRCVPTIYKEGGDYDQRVATGMCADHYEGKTTQMSSVFRKIKGIKLY